MIIQQQYTLIGNNGEKFTFTGTTEDLENFVIEYETRGDFYCVIISDTSATLSDSNTGDIVFRTPKDAQKYIDFYNKEGEEAANKFLESL